jgi:hypothetical protein
MKLDHLLNGLSKKSVKCVVDESDITLVDICAFAGNVPGAETIANVKTFEKLISYTPRIAETIDLINWQYENVFMDDKVNLIPSGKRELEKLSDKLFDAYEWRCRIRDGVNSLLNASGRDFTDSNVDHENVLNVLYEYVNTIKTLNYSFEKKIYDGEQVVIETSVEASKADHKLVGSAVGYHNQENKSSIILTRDIDIPKIFIEYLDSLNADSKDQILDKVKIYFVDKGGKDCWHLDPRGINGRAKNFIWSLEKSKARVPVYKK